MRAATSSGRGKAATDLGAGGRRIMEYWDIYDIHRRKLGYCLARCTGAELPEGCTCRAALADTGKLDLRPEEYHLSVHIWFINARGELLIQKRAENKRHMPGVWAACGGAVMAGEDSLTAAVRESYEEMGIIVDPARLVRILTYTSPERHSHMDVYMYRYECDPDALTLQEEEVSRAGWFPLEALTGKTFTDEQFRRYTYMDILYSLVKSHADWRRRGFMPGHRHSRPEPADVYDMRGNRTGRKADRSDALPFGDYLWSIHVWFIGSDGQALLQRRSMHCTWRPGDFAALGGGVMAGETPMEAARREVMEEMGVSLDERNTFQLCQYVDEQSLCTVYVANQDVASEELHLNREEVSAVQFVSADMLSAYSSADNFLRPLYLPMVTSAMRVIERSRHI